MRHKGVGFIFQTFNLFPVLIAGKHRIWPAMLDGTVLGMSMAEREEWVAHIIVSVGLEDR